MLLKTAWRIVIAVIGGTIVLIGAAMILLPGPAIIVIPAGLAVLATEFAWAKHLLKRLKEQTRAIFKRPPVVPTTPARTADAKAPDAT